MTAYSGWGSFKSFCFSLTPPDISFQVDRSKWCYVEEWETSSAISDGDEKIPEQAECQHQLRDTGSDRSLEQAQKWILDCVQNHETCAHRGMERIFPTRLLYIGTHEDQSVRLCETTTWLPDTTSTLEQYTTLSHCWGKVPIIRLLKENITRFQSNIPFEYLPKTFQDAIHVTRALGVLYIWIDSLCIIQDSTDDWQKESLNMVNIYSNSYCNIAATKASEGSEGCFTERSSWSCPIVVKLPTISSGSRPVVDDTRTRSDLQDRTFPSGSYRVHWDGLWEDEINISPLLQRAWVFQERVLSPRVLHFAKSRIFFECRETTFCQGYPDGLPDLKVFRLLSLEEKADFEYRNSNDNDVSKTGVFLTWQKSVFAYSKCDITNEEDRFVAIAGVARRLQPILGCRYLAGLWEYQLIKQLAWCKNIPWPPGSSSIAKTTASSPSWTWLSNMEVGISISYVVPGRGSCDMKVEDVHVVTIDGNEFSQAISGSLLVTARLIPVQYDGRGPEVELRRIRRYVHFDIAITDPKVKLFCTICVLIDDVKENSFFEGLLLRRTIGKRGFYHRVGMVPTTRGTDTKKILCRGEAMEKAEITEDCYEIYHEDIDKYTFTII
ncbi:heterokaryon incompatibility protein [Rutstroemia sp. NJR-2017a WRK4]|nr:heterokaryon incompatibility protein [Rutstroemia sp. NJR-2017a WRK4]